ncbi:hypothetical protein PQ455_08735 [Sphingomonas naphthae]|uniref:DUF3617 family protein n=1 Tax=Sphingomonas naphthae TaxID=1813468 RepID=A0ABY7TPX0_9SPHN|nr:hypothetical protein [Sphingomonas naphthae]WCT75286.1 hypothetical protein PQ455_08735 [Sphingomonas naphthae]
MRNGMKLAAGLLGCAALAAPALAERIMAPPTPNFVVGYNASNAQMQMVELVPKGQTVQAWTTMITTQRMIGMKVPAATFLTELSKKLSAACPKGSATAVPMGGSAGLRYDCRMNTATGKMETTFARAINGPNDLYVVQVAYRSLAMPKEAGWAREYLGNVRLMP